MTNEAPGHAGMTEADFAYLERLAAAAADSGLYGGTGARVKAQLLMKLIYGRDLQIPVSAALSAIDIYDGKMELSSNLIAGLLEAHPHYAYAIVETSDERCELEFFKDASSIGKAKFDRADATTAGLVDTEYYRQYPSDMFFARAMTRGARRYCPGLGRGVAIYARGELAKPTPDPTPTNGSPATTGRPVDAPRAAASDVSRIRALAGEARVGDAELFNILIVAAGRDPVKDEQRAARQLDRALASLPISLVPKVIDALTQRVTAPAGTASANGQAPGAQAA
ncbi:MAG TPA: hypothetical protein VHZ31_03865 [Solirubrobacteraceae bacterium]|nr:hypothetical protein [Solirubrobacteraceae bacterium]